MKLRYALELAIANELGMRETYLMLLKKTNPHEQELVRLWDTMAEEETRHAEILTDIKDAISDEDLEAQLDFSVVPLDEFARKLDDFRERLGRERQSRDDVLRFAMEMEMGEQNDVLRQLVAACPTDLGNHLAEELVDTSLVHMRGLLSAIGRLAHDPKLREEVQFYLA